MQTHPLRLAVVRDYDANHVRRGENACPREGGRWVPEGNHLFEEACSSTDSGDPVSDSNWPGQFVTTAEHQHKNRSRSKPVAKFPSGLATVNLNH